MARTVLLADDSVTAQNMGRRILTDAGYEVITVNNGSAALKKIHEIHPDLIILDVYMPGYGGLEVCQRLKESGETMRIPVLLSVGKMEPFKADEAKRVRADAHIVKPFEASELLAALAKLEDRIVPPPDSAHGRKKKPSFWHGEEDTATQRDWTENAEYLAQAKQRKNGDAQEPIEVTPEVEAQRKAAAFPSVPESAGELPVIADAIGMDSESDVSVVEQNEPSATPSAVSVGESTEISKAAGVDATAVLGGASSEANDSHSASSPQQSETNHSSSLAAADADSASVSASGSDSPVGADANSQALQRQDNQGTVEPPASVPSAGRWVAENVALTPEEAALELDQEMRAVENGQRPEDVSVSSFPAISSEPSNQSGGATFAAAAGAGFSAVGTSLGTSSEETEPAIPAESAAAWENWQQIRETVMNGPTAAAIADTVALAAKATLHAEPATPPVNVNESQEPSAAATSPAESAPSSQMEAGALATLVDSVLAELKPKLMEEIAKKLKK